MNLSKYEHAERKEAEASKDAPETPQDSGAEQKHHTLFGKQFTEKEQKTLFLYLVIGIDLMELAVTVGAIIISITNAQPSSSGVPHFQFPWIGYLVAVVMVPVLAMLLVNLVSLGFSRGARGGEDVNLEGVPQRMQTFYALVRGAPTVILFAGFVLMCAAIYYLDGVMSLLLKLGENFHLVAIWVVGGFAVAWMVSYVVRAWMHYKTKQMEAEYAFRHEVLERTGMVILDTKHAPTTELRMLPPVPGGQPGALPPAVDVDASLETNVEEMTEAAQAVRTGEVTWATRDSKDAEGNPIAEGDVIGIADGSIEAVDDSIDGAVLTLLGKMEAEDADTCTILAGEGYSDEDLEALVAKIEEAYDELEVDAQRGEQPLYPIVFSVE